MAIDTADFAKLYPSDFVPELSDTERKRTRILVVEPDPNIRITMRQALVSAGFMNISESNEFKAALNKLDDNEYTHIIFDVKKGLTHAREFLTTLLQYNNKLICVPSSYEPTIDDVFDLLIYGARGYIVKPFTSGSVDEAICWATKGEPVSDSIRFAKSRNEALASLMTNSLDKLAHVLVQARKFDTAKLEVKKKRAGFLRTVDIGRTFAQGGPEKLIENIIELCLEKASEEAPATQLGKTRKRIDDERATKHVVAEDASPLQ